MRQNRMAVLEDLENGRRMRSDNKNILGMLIELMRISAFRIGKILEISEYPISKYQ